MRDEKGKKGKKGGNEEDGDAADDDDDDDDDDEDEVNRANLKKTSEQVTTMEMMIRTMMIHVIPIFPPQELVRWFFSLT